MVDLSEMSGLSENGQNVRIVRKQCAIIMLRVSEISSPETGNIAFSRREA